MVACVDGGGDHVADMDYLLQVPYDFTMRCVSILGESCLRSHEY